MAQRLPFRIRQALVALATVATVALLHVGGAHALEIRIKGSAELEAKFSNASTMLQVSGRLVDELGRGIRERKIGIKILDENRRPISNAQATTGIGGAFTFNEEIPPGIYWVEAQFEGSEHHDSTGQRERVTVKPEPIRLTVYAPRFVHGRAKALVHASASTGSQPVVGSASVFVNGSSVGDLTFDAAGRGGFDVSNHLQEGSNNIHVLIPGSAHREEERAQTSIFFARTLTVEATATERLDRLRRGIGVNGRVVAGGTPIEDLRVSVRIAPSDIDPTLAKRIRPLRDTAVTDSNGEFDAFFPATKLVDGVWSVDVEVVPPVGARIRQRAGSVEWTTKVQRAVLNGVWVVALLGLFGIVASYGWVWLRAAWIKRRRRREALARQEAAFVAEERIVPVRLDPDSSGEILPRDSIRGLVWDVWTAQPIPHAHISVQGAGQTYQAKTDERGWFSIETVPTGDYNLEVSAHGFVKGKLEVEIPHNGIFSNFRMDLVAVPLKIRRLFQSVIEATAGEDLWGKRSPQEIEKMLASAFSDQQEVVRDGAERNALRQKILAHLEASGETIDGRELLGAITTLVEESYYSGKAYDETLWFAVREIGLRLRGGG